MTEANQKAKDVIAKYGLYAAYSWLHNRIIYEKNNWPSAIDLEKIAGDQQVLDELAHRIAKETLLQNGWDFAKHDEGGPEDWEFDPFGIKGDVSMKKLVDEPQNLLRKIALFRRLRADIEAFQATYPPIFDDDPDLRALADDLDRRMREIEERLSKKEI